MSTATAVPPQAASANTKALTEAMAAASISSPKPNGDADASGHTSDLEDGEIRDGADEDAEAEDDGSVKTVFDDARRFNVKVSAMGVGSGSG